ncbi:MAG TPA: TolC family protein, partial [Candidatus Krumholzibacteria bacterium]
MLALGTTTAHAQDDRPVLNLSIDEAVARALENNVDIAVERYSPEIQDAALISAKGPYDPYLQALVDHNTRTVPGQSAFSGGDEVSTDTQNWSLSASQLFKTGGVLTVSWQNSKTDTDNVFNSFNPSFSSSLNVSLTQPLLRDRSIDSARQQLRVSSNNVEVSGIQFRQAVINVVANVKVLYYNLIFAADNLEAQRKSLALAQRLLEENKIKVRVGTLAPLDVVEAEAEVAGRVETVIVGEAALEDAEDAIKQVIFPATDPETWMLRVVPTDRATAEPREIDTAAAITKALENRTDARASRINLDNNEISLEYARNQVKPGLDLEASYGGIGIGGTQIVRDGLGGPIIEEIPGGYGDATSQVFGNDFPTWRIGVRFSYPILNRSAKGNEARLELAKQQAEASLRRLEFQIAREVRSAARSVKTNSERIDSTKAARVLQQRRLDAEEKRFAAGMSTNFLVTQAQRELAFAEVNELQAIADYRKSLIEFDRVQEAGGGGLVLTGGTGASQTNSVAAGQGTLRSGIANQGPQ